MKFSLSAYLVAAFILAVNWLTLARDGFEGAKRLGILACATVFYLVALLLDWKKKNDLIPLLGIIFIVLVYLLYLILYSLNSYENQGTWRMSCPLIFIPGRPAAKHQC